MTILYIYIFLYFCCIYYQDTLTFISLKTIVFDEDVSFDQENKYISNRCNEL